MLRKIMQKLRRRTAEKYVNRLLAKSITLQDIPISFLRDPALCSTIYISAFRADRSMPLSQYQADFYLVEREILIAESTQNTGLAEILKHVKDSTAWWLEDHAALKLEE